MGERTLSSMLQLAPCPTIFSSTKCLSMMMLSLFFHTKMGDIQWMEVT